MGLGERIREVRKDCSITQGKFAERMLVSASYISKIESGKEIPSDIFLKLMSLEFNVSLKWLRDGEGTKDIYTGCMARTGDVRRQRMTRFDVLQAITDVEKYARHVWGMMQCCHDEKDVERIMRSELSEDGRQCMVNAAQNGYPLSLERLQNGIKEYGIPEKCIISGVNFANNQSKDI